MHEEERKIKELIFKCTCYMCPEQYDVFTDTGKMVGYVRLRHSYLTCDYPDCGDKLIYRHIFDESLDKGAFESEEERMYYLTIIASHILEEISNQN